MERIDVAVIGAGVTGLASALALAARGRSVCVLERHPRPGLDTSTHNSGVIHGGIYYPAGSLKSRLCIEGRRLLYDFCHGHGVPHARCGKLIVAREDGEIPKLEALFTPRRRERRRRPSDGRPRVHRRTGAERSRGRGHLFARDRHRGRRSARQGAPARRRSGRRDLPAGHPARRRRVRADGIEIRTGQEAILAGAIVNAAGLYADEVSAMLGGEPLRSTRSAASTPSWCPQSVRWSMRLVYPLPHAAGHGLGVHATKSTAGNVWFGPTVKYQDRKDDYEATVCRWRNSPRRRRQLLPDVTVADLRLSGSGIRPKLHPPSDSFADFLIRRDRQNPHRPRRRASNRRA